VATGSKVCQLFCVNDQVLFLGREREGRGNIPFLDLYFSAVARNHLSLGWRRSNSHYRSSRISDTRSEGSERQGRKVASPPLVSACTSTVSPWLVPFIHLKCKLTAVRRLRSPGIVHPSVKGQKIAASLRKGCPGITTRHRSKAAQTIDRGSAQPYRNDTLLSSHEQSGS
jgi:hypothetical protein